MNEQYIQQIAKLAEQCQTPGIHHIRVIHDDNCQAILAGSMDSCTCNPVSRMSNEQEFIEVMEHNREMRRAAAKAARKGKDGK